LKTACLKGRGFRPYLQTMNISLLPKVELHLHLDCSLSFDLVKQLTPQVSLEEYQREFIAPPKCTNLADFLSRAPRSIDLLQTKYALEQSIHDLFRQLARDNVIYAEIRFAPLFHLRQGLTPEHVVEVVEQATEAQVRETGIEARLILCTLRHFTAEQSAITAHLVEHFRGTRVAALDIAGDEAGYPLTAHINAYRYAIQHDLPRTAHAGEARGADSVWETLQQLQPSRIGHGVRSIEDPRLIDYLIEHRIHLEICPTCNVQIDIFPTYADHPINTLYQRGVSLGISTDCRTITNVTLNEEYEKMARVFGWGANDFLQVNLNALEVSFQPPEICQQLKQHLRETYAALEISS
jgi:adenosine deaminase